MLTAIKAGDIKLKTMNLVALMLATLAIGFFSVVIYFAAREGFYVPFIWTALMLVVYLPVVSIVCSKKGTKQMWRRRAILSIVGFMLYGLLLGAGLIIVFH